MRKKMSWVEFPDAATAPVTNPTSQPAAATPATIIPIRRVSGDGRRARYTKSANIKQAIYGRSKSIEGINCFLAKVRFRSRKGARYVQEPRFATAVGLYR
jgi:hypothetical protein